MPDKLDLVKAHKNYYGAQVTPSLGYFGPLPYLSIRGRGEPEGEIYTAALSALYSVAYGVKKLCKAEGRDFVVPKLEGLWWVDGAKPCRRSKFRVRAGTGDSWCNFPLL